MNEMTTEQQQKIETLREQGHLRYAAKLKRSFEKQAETQTQTETRTITTTIIEASNSKLEYAIFKLKKAYAYNVTNLFQATHRLGRIEDAYKAIEDALHYQREYNNNRK
jgi:hypothetical protein